MPSRLAVDAELDRADAPQRSHRFYDGRLSGVTWDPGQIDERHLPGSLTNEFERRTESSSSVRCLDADRQAEIEASPERDHRWRRRAAIPEKENGRHRNTTSRPVIPPTAAIRPGHSRSSSADSATKDLRQKARPGKEAVPGN